NNIAQTAVEFGAVVRRPRPPHKRDGLRPFERMLRVRVCHLIVRLVRIVRTAREIVHDHSFALHSVKTDATEYAACACRAIRKRSSAYGVVTRQTAPQPWSSSHSFIISPMTAMPGNP